MENIKNKYMKKALVVSSAIGVMVLLEPAPVQAVENNGNNIDSNVENVNMRLANKGQVVNVSTNLRIRKTPSTTSEILGNMPQGTTVDIISKEGEWYKISWNSIVGYAHSDYIEEINQSSNENIIEYAKVINVSTNLRVRSNSSTDSNILGYLLNNDSVIIVDSVNEWYKIEYNGGYGYVHKDYIKVDIVIGNNGDDDLEENAPEENLPEDSDENLENDSEESLEEDLNEESENTNQIGYVYNVAGSNLRVRSQPSTQGEILGVLYDGQAVSIIGESGDWYQIKYNDGIAYVSQEYITVPVNDSTESEVQIGKIINITTNLRVRQQPSTSSMVLGYLLNGTRIEIIGKEGTWYKINFGQYSGYVSEEYVTTDVTNEDTSRDEIYNIALNTMKNQIGSPYVWGGSGESLTSQMIVEFQKRFPNEAAEGRYNHAKMYADQGYLAFDCSGLMQWAFGKAGIYIGRTTYNQIYNGVEVPLSDLQPGDLLFTHSLGHVGMYIGDGKWIESPESGSYIRIVDVPWNSIGRARRVF